MTVNVCILFSNITYIFTGRILRHLYAILRYEPIKHKKLQLLQEFERIDIHFYLVPVYELISVDPGSVKQLNLMNIRMRVADKPVYAIGY